jgi:hypothetical protein
VSLYDPDGVINNVFAFEALKLQVDVHVQSVVSACFDTSKQLEILAQESVA